MILERIAGLQWGRAVEGAETPELHMRADLAAYQLQWGRAVEGAETNPWVWVVEFRRVELQWGRAVEGAETWESGHIVRYTGQASMGPRR